VQQQIPFGDDNQNGTDKGNSKSNGVMVGRALAIPPILTPLSLLNGTPIRKERDGWGTPASSLSGRDKGREFLCEDRIEIRVDGSRVQGKVEDPILHRHLDDGAGVVEKQIRELGWRF
jgi:hypothetical protein